MLHISKLKNEHLWCVSVLKRYDLLEERATAENSFLALTSKLTHPKSIGLLKRGIINMRVSSLGI